MSPLDYYLAAIGAQAHLRKDWVISVFAVSSLSDGTGGVKYPYQLLNIDGEYGFINPADNSLMVFEGFPVTESLLDKRTVCDVPAYALPNIDSPIRTTIGNLLFNAIVLAYPFGAKIAYINGAASISAIEKIIVRRMVDDPIDTPPADLTLDDKLQTIIGGAPTDLVSVDPTTAPIYVSEYRKFAEAAMALAGYATLFTPGATARTLTPAPGYKELKAQLLAKYHNRLDDATVIAEIEQQLFLLDDKWIKEDPDFGFVRTAKIMRIARKRMFYSHGIETGFSEDGSFTYIPTSLNDGWDISKLPAMINSLRDGSHNRGAQTALGGEKTKTIFRVMTGAIIESEDCGAKLGITRIVRAGTANMYRTSIAIPIVAGTDGLESGEQFIITEESLAPYMGQTIMIRSPLYCLASNNNFCLRCMGEFMRGHETSLGVVAAACGSALLSMFMAKMHGTILSTTHYDIFTELR